MTEPRNLFEPYDADACEVCGKCLQECPVMGMNERAAKREMRRLRGGGMPERALAECQTCFACNLVCPNHANPAQLMLDRFNAWYRVHGVPARALYFQPHAPRSFRAFIQNNIPDDEKELVASWENNREPCEEFVYPGCNMCNAAYLTKTKLLEGLDIRGGIDLCCGEMYYRTGQFDRLAETAQRLNRFVRRLKARRMMILCSAGYNMFTNVLPRFGFDAPVELVSYIQWLGEKLDRDELPFEKKLDMTVTVQDSCYGKVFGADYTGTPRRLLEAVGVKIVEMKHNCDKSLCCGIGGGFPVKSGYNPIAMTLSSGRVFADALATGADAIAAYCAGCMLSLCTARVLVPSPQPVYHFIQLLAMAAGEEPLDRNMDRGRLMLEGVVRNQFPTLLSTRRYKTIPLRDDVDV